MEDKRKEVLDFLRNRQKFAEIKAKTSGINLWVIVAAASLVFWAAIDLYDEKNISLMPFLAWHLVAAQSIYYVLMLSSRSAVERNDLRYMSFDESNPVLFLLAAAWSLVPSVFFLIEVGVRAVVFPLIFFGASIFFVAFLNAKKIAFPSKAKKIFPDARFTQSSRFDLLMTLAISLALVLSFLDSYFSLKNFNNFDENSFKFCCLISTFYILTVVAINKKHADSEMSWTYEVETNLLLDLISVDVAIRKIEHRAFGVRVGQVMDDFFDDLDKKMTSLRECFEQAMIDRRDIESLPTEYRLERIGRWKAAVTPSLALVSEINSEIGSVVDYLLKLKNLSLDVRVRDAVEINSARAKKYLDQVKEITRSIENVSKEIAVDIGP